MKRGITGPQFLLGKCDSEQARAKQDKTRQRSQQKTVRSEFFTDGTPPSPIANKINFTHLIVGGRRRFALPLGTR
jgi:hypothetical protein